MTTQQSRIFRELGDHALPPGLRRRVAAGLAGRDYVASASEGDVLAIPGVGPGGVRTLVRAGFRLRDMASENPQELIENLRVSRKLYIQLKRPCRTILLLSDLTAADVGRLQRLGFSLQEIEEIQAALCELGLKLRPSRDV